MTELPEATRVLLDTGIEHLKKRDRAGAIRSFTAATQAAPRHPAPWILLANALIQDGQLEAAVTAARRAVAADDHNIDAHLVLGAVYAQRDAADDADAAFQRALELAGDDAEACDHVCDAMERSGLFDLVVDVRARQAAELPDDVVAQSRLAHAQAAAGLSDEAITTYREVLRLNPADAHAQVVMFDLLAEVGREDEAMAHARAAILSPTVDDQAKAELEKRVKSALGGHHHR